MVFDYDNSDCSSGDSWNPGSGSDSLCVDFCMDVCGTDTVPWEGGTPPVGGFQRGGRTRPVRRQTGGRARPIRRQVGGRGRPIRRQVGGGGGYVYEATGQPYNGQVVEAGGLFYTTITGTIEGNSQKVMTLSEYNYNKTG